MAATGLRSDERIGLGLALALHAALVAVLVWRPPTPALIAPPERISVTLSDDVGLTSTSPEPAAQAAPDVAPELGEPAPPAPAEAAEPDPAPAPPRPVTPPPQPKVQPRAQPEPRPEPPRPVVRPAPAPRPVARPVPRPVAQPRPTPPRPTPPRPAPPRPAAKPAAKPAPPSPIAARIAAANARNAARPAAAAARPSPAARPTNRSVGVAPASKPPAKAGGSRIGNDFLSGVPNATTQGPARAAPAAAIGPAQKSALNSAISREIKPHWAVPQGADAELLVTRVRFRLARDGSLSGTPEVLGTTGVNPTNQAQVKRHQEQAIRAVRLAAPFDLPEDLYSAWQVVTTNFDRRLAQ